MSANNHLLYRGYVVDKGTGLYYLQSRYYDPNVGRFLNADAFASTDQGIIGNNMFAYCLNNPANGSDPCGTCYHSEVFWKDCDRCKHVKYDVPLYSQGDHPMCWAYCQAMIESYHKGEVLSQEEADKRVRKIGIKRYGRKIWNRPGSPANRVPVEVNSINDLYEALNTHGPLYAAYSQYNEDGTQRGGHAVVVTGADLRTNTVYTNNPSGIYGEQVFDVFIQVFASTGYRTGWELSQCYDIM